MATDLDAKWADVADLAEWFRRGGKDAVDEVLRIFGPVLRAWLRKTFGRLLARDEVELIVFDALTEAWQCAAKCGRENFAGWLFTITYRAAVHFLRSVSIDGQRPVHFADPDRIFRVVDPRNGNESNELSTNSPAGELIRQALADLSAPQREVVISDYWLGGEATDKELALAFGVAESTIRSYRRRAVLKLREVLTDLGVEKFLRVQRSAHYLGRETNSAEASSPASSDFGTGNGERGTGNGERGTGNGERGTGNGQLIVAFTKSVPQWRYAFRDAIPTIFTCEPGGSVCEPLSTQAPPIASRFDR